MQCPLDLDVRPWLDGASQEADGQSALLFSTYLAEVYARPEIFAIAFDLARPLNEQVRHAVRSLKRAREDRTAKGLITPDVQRQYRFNDYRCYLQVFDAYAAKVPAKDVVDFFVKQNWKKLESEDSFQKKLKRASALVNGEYRFIATAANKAKKRAPKK